MPSKCHLYVMINRTLDRQELLTLNKLHMRKDSMKPALISCHGCPNKEVLNQQILAEVSLIVMSLLSFLY